MAPKDDSFKVYVESELLREIDGITTRRMFGSFGIYLRGIFIGLIHGGTVYLKTDDKTQQDYEDLGSRPFTYRKKGKTMTLSFWEVPAAMMDNPSDITVWVAKAYEAAIRNKKKK